MPLMLGLAVAGAGGYYLYNAGGDAKSATKHFEGEKAVFMNVGLYTSTRFHTR